MTDSSNSIGVLIVDDHAVVRAGLRLLLESHPGVVVVGEASNCRDAITCVGQEQPDIILLDLDLGSENAIDSLPKLIGAGNGRIIILTGVRDIVLHRRAVTLGAMGLVQKEKAAEILLKAIEHVHAGEVWLDPALTASVLAMMRVRESRADTDPEVRKIATLTKREREVISTVARGLKNKQIADRLFISETTVRHHLTSIFGKLDVSDRLELLVYAFRHGIVEPPR